MRSSITGRCTIVGKIEGVAGSIGCPHVKRRGIRRAMWRNLLYLCNPCILNNTSINGLNMIKNIIAVQI